MTPLSRSIFQDVLKHCFQTSVFFWFISDYGHTLLVRLDLKRGSLRLVVMVKECLMNMLWEYIMKGAMATNLECFLLRRNAGIQELVDLLESSSRRGKWSQKPLACSFSRPQPRANPSPCPWVQEACLELWVGIVGLFQNCHQGNGADGGRGRANCKINLFLKKNQRESTSWPEVQAICKRRPPEEINVYAWK